MNFSVCPRICPIATICFFLTNSVFLRWNSWIFYAKPYNSELGCCGMMRPLNERRRRCCLLILWRPSVVSRGCFLAAGCNYTAIVANREATYFCETLQRYFDTVLLWTIIVESCIGTQICPTPRRGFPHPKPPPTKKRRKILPSLLEHVNPHLINLCHW